VRIIAACILALTLAACAQTVYSYYRADGVPVLQQVVQADIYACTKQNTTNAYEVSNFFGQTDVTATPKTDTNLVNLCMQAKGYAVRAEKAN